MKGSLVGALLVVIAAVGGFVYTIAVGNEPLLGLDLQGGVSVVLQPDDGCGDDEPDCEPAPSPTDEAMEQALEVIRNRVDGLGVAEPSISRQGDTIVVELPGVDQQQRALDLVGQTAELRFRPVIADTSTMLTFGLISAEDAGLDVVEDDTADTVETDGTETDTAVETDGTDTADTADETDTADADAGDEQGMEAIRRRQTTSTTEADAVDETLTTDDDVLETESGDATDETTTDEVTTDDASTDEATTDEAVDVTDAEAEAFLDALATACGGGLTQPEDNESDRAVVLNDADGLPLCLGPVVSYGTNDDGTPKYLTGAALETASVTTNGFEWVVNPTFKEGADGIDAFNYAASLCFGGLSEECPFARLAIVLDEAVISAPTINAASFARDQIQISGSFDDESANDLALALRYGALPVELTTESVNNISASVGSDVLRSGIIAGIVGLGLVALYLLYFYRLAGLVAIGGLAISGLLLWTMIGWLGENYGLAITVSGIVGLIVSIGVSADSNIVYFENVKELVASGRRTTTAVERAYRSAISTIVKADVVSLIAAGLLYFLTVGAVKGFALYLGVATILDLIVSLFFMRPALAWLAERFATDPRRFGMPGAEK